MAKTEKVAKAPVVAIGCPKKTYHIQFILGYICPEGPGRDFECKALASPNYKLKKLEKYRHGNSK